MTTQGVIASVPFIAWNLAPIVAMALAVPLTERFFFRAMWVIAAGVFVLVTLTTWAFLDHMTNESSTDALLFLFFPVYEFLMLGVLIGAAAAVHALRGRHPRAQAPSAA
ncbi:hypothetical protein [Jannaschia sp. R86511]|uniref:hypothetical protein n=1 Tax=Jannaschia sp. R86511 TaxID=3093853 RepID=UPI0036D3B41A